MDDLTSKIELMMYRMKLPRSTVLCQGTFNHLMPAVDTQYHVNPKEEMDIDTTETQKDTEMEDKENGGDNINTQTPTNDDGNVIIASDEDDATPNRNGKNKKYKRQNFDRKLDEYNLVMQVSKR
eukprot:305630_1